MSTDNLITVEELAGRSRWPPKAIKKKPGLMKSTVGYMEMVHKYVERIVTAKTRQIGGDPRHPQPLEIDEAMDVVGVFNDFWGVISDLVGMPESVPRP